jgi:hypothetical protein
MSNSRIYTIRKSATLDPEKIMLPLLFVNKQFGYSVDTIFRKIHSAPEVHLGTDVTFPNTIEEYFWIHEGQQGKEPWIALGLLNNGIYFLFSAYMISPTGSFFKNGHMNLWASTRFSDLIQFAMDSSIYSLYLENTS